jgi:predicted ABC-class ATPase
MKSVETRIDFPDYTAENQERDARRYLEKQKKDIYIVKVNGHYGAYMPDGDDFISYGNCKAKDLTEFYNVAHKYFKSLKINHRFHCVHNKGIEDYILHQVALQKLLGR